MIYNNLIALLAAIFLLATGSVPEQPHLGGVGFLSLLLLKALLLWLLARHLFRRAATGGAGRYFSTELRLTIAALFSLAVDIHLLDCPYYLAKLPLADTLPFLEHAAGLTLFFGYLSLVWLAARPAYQRTFGRTISRGAFLSANLKINLAMVLPWLVLSASANLLQLVPIPLFRTFLDSPWGEPLLLLLSFLVLVVLLPPAIVRLWGCTSLPPGPVRQRIEAFCQAQQLRFADILLWPLFEGRMLTAGVMGIHGRFRYLLVTPFLLESMTKEELEAVMAHEIGHVKFFHLQLYLLLFLGFGLLVQLGSVPLLLLLMDSALFQKLIIATGQGPDTILTVSSTVAVFALILLYFRYIFGFFMRNFERQADLHALDTMGHAGPLVRVFEKIAWLSGNIRDLPSWHHFGIGQRIDFLQRCEAEPRLVDRHHRKVRLTLLLYLVLLGVGIVQVSRLPQDLLEQSGKARLVEAILQRKMIEQPDNALWVQLLGDLRYSLGQDRQAIDAYQQALTIAPDNQDALNNLAWLLLTSPDPSLRDPEQALSLAKQAADQGETAAVLDTLATALWMNGFPQEAVAKETTALAMASNHREFYARQLERFQRLRPTDPGALSFSEPSIPHGAQP